MSVVCDKTTGYKSDIAQVLYGPREIAHRVNELARQVSRDYRGLNPVFVGILKGTSFFFADLLRQVTMPCQIDFLAISSYTSGTVSSGAVRLVKDLDFSIEGRHVVMIEDIVDTGLTLRYVMRNLRARRPASLEVCCLLNKPARRLADVDLRYVGFEIPDLFVVGYGLDYNQFYRNLPFIGILDDRIYAS